MQQEKGVIELTNTVITTSDKGNKKYIFTLSNFYNKTFTFCCTSATERSKWVEFIKQCTVESKFIPNLELTTAPQEQVEFSTALIDEEEF